MAKRSSAGKSKNLSHHTARSNISQKSDRERMKRELMRIAESVGVDTRYAKIKISEGGSSDRIIVQGVFSETASGYGFVSSDKYTGRDIFIPRGKCGEAIGGDSVEVAFKEYIAEGGELRTEGKILRVFSARDRDIIGRLDSALCYVRGSIKESYVLVPDDIRIKRQIIIMGEPRAELGDKLLCHIDRSSVKTDYAECSMVANLGPAESCEANYTAILHECGISTEFTKEELELADKMAAISLYEQGRRRISDVVFTVDGAGAKDLDDAVSITKRSDGWTLGVHIADVSTYVREKTALDRLVMARGTSVYFTDRVVPMLPVSLSNGACSLNPDEDKYTLSAIIELDRDGEIASARVEPTITRSLLRGIYSEVNAIFDGTADEKLLEKYKACLSSLSDMHELYLVLKQKEAKRGALNLDGEEAYITLDDNGAPISIEKCVRGDGEKMIEQFMLTANEAVARLLHDRELPCIYRIHETPPAEKLEDFVSYASVLGFDTREISKEGAGAGQFEKLLDEARERGLSEPISYAMLRSMSKAVYSEIKRPHFGLGIDTYCHFTSPIRRLSDLATHRIIHKCLLGEQPAEKFRSYAKRAAAAATDGEIRAMSAERRIENLYKVIFMSNHIGEEFPARISGINDFGFFARLDNTCEGLVPTSDMPGVYIFDEKNLTLRGMGKIFRVGDEITVRLEEADITRGKLRFSLIEKKDNPD